MTQKHLVAILSVLLSPSERQDWATSENLSEDQKESEPWWCDSGDIYDSILETFEYSKLFDVETLIENWNDDEVASTLDSLSQYPFRLVESKNEKWGLTDRGNMWLITHPLFSQYLQHRLSIDFENLTYDPDNAHFRDDDGDVIVVKC